MTSGNRVPRAGTGRSHRGRGEGAAKVIQYFAFHGQINQRGIAEVEIGTRELLVIVREHRSVARVGIHVQLGRNPGIDARWTWESMRPGMRKPPSAETMVAPAGGLVLAFLSTRAM